MHPSFPFGLLSRLRDPYYYFRTGVKVEGKAVLCDQPHGPFLIQGDVSIGTDPVPQHIDVEVKFWNRRGGRVTVIELAEARILSRAQRLAVAEWRDFEPAELDAGSRPVERLFSIIPKDDPKGRVEVSMGEMLELRFRPSRGSERWAQPTIQMHLQ